MADRWNEMLRDCQGGAVHWRRRLATAAELVEALRTGELVEPAGASRALLGRLAGDPKWQVRKAVANGLYLLDDELFDELAGRLGRDANTFVRRFAQKASRLRRRDRSRARQRETADRRFARRVARFARKHGRAAADEASALGQMRFNQLAGGLAHDLRSLLAHLQPAATALERRLADGGQPAAHLKAARVVQSVALMDRCVGDLERFTEPLRQDRQVEDLGAVVRAAGKMAIGNIENLGFEASRVELRQHVADGLRLGLSRHMIVLALANLIKNAYEAFMDGPSELRRGVVTVTGYAADGRVHIDVRDDGVGMTAEQVEDLAAALPRRRNKAKRRSTGYGVPIARRYVEAHGGTLTFESRPDEGTVARIALPRTPPPSEAIE
ncbi:MAG: HAMP domain-containing histidine kinase [Phycisphaerae bacterium]|nr:HAMP domain-containing histidine kinase [Phycisphaerae bacterium]